jgi:hypothetical protein
MNIIRMALEALDSDNPDIQLRAATALRAAIEHYDQTALELCEECGWKALIPGEGCLTCARQKAPREWVELTDDEARALVNRATFGDKTNWQALVYMIDAKLKEKNAA